MRTLIAITIWFGLMCIPESFLHTIPIIVRILFVTGFVTGFAMSVLQDVKELLSDSAAKGSE